MAVVRVTIPVINPPLLEQQLVAAMGEKYLSLVHRGSDGLLTVGLADPVSLADETQVRRVVEKHDPSHMTSKQVNDSVRDESPLFSMDAFDVGEWILSLTPEEAVYALAVAFVQMRGLALGR